MSELVKSPELDDISFFANGFAETAHKPHLGKNASGPFARRFNDALAPISDALARINPDLDPSFLGSKAYYTTKMHARYDTLSTEQKILLDHVCTSKELAVTKAFADIWPELKTQTIEPRLLAEPPSASSLATFVDDGISGTRACANTCFRMTFAGITGVMPTVKSVALGGTRVFGDSMLDNSAYLNFFNSSAFAQFSKKRITTVDLIGADFDMIASLARIVSKKGGTTFCTIPLKSEVASTVQHHVILTKASTNTVTFKDPKQGETKNLQTQAFCENWAHALNQAMIVIAT